MTCKFIGPPGGAPFSKARPSLFLTPSFYGIYILFILETLIIPVFRYNTYCWTVVISSAVVHGSRPTGSGGLVGRVLDGVCFGAGAVLLCSLPCADAKSRDAFTCENQSSFNSMATPSSCLALFAFLPTRESKACECARRIVALGHVLKGASRRRPTHAHVRVTHTTYEEGGRERGAGRERKGARAHGCINIRRYVLGPAEKWTCGHRSIKYIYV